MSLSVALICLISSLGWSLFDLSRKKVTTHIHPLVALLYYMIFTLPLFGVWMFFTGKEFSHQYWLIGLPGVFINFVANISFIESVKRSPLSATVPLLSFIPVGAALLSYLFLGEELNMNQVMGVGVVVVGALILNGRINFADAESKGIALMGVAAVGWSGMIVVDKLSLEHASLPAHASLQTIGIMLIALLFIKMKSLKLDFSELGPTKKYLWIGVIGAFIGIGFQLIALPQADVGAIEATKRAGNMALSLLWGAVLFSEKINLRKLIAFIVLSLGVLMVLDVLSLGF